MKIRPYIYISFLLFYVPAYFCSAQGQWVWMKGGSGLNQGATYGTKGVFAAANTPGARYEPCEWTDNNGHFWLYGGSNGSSHYGDLWEYDPVANQWRWVSGDNTANTNPVHGTQGVAAAGNKPGARALGTATWTDNNGNLWMFGGGVNNTSTMYNDLWKYDITLSQWTWIKGSTLANQPGTYGTKGVPAAANNPGARIECACTWIDNNGDLWIFGGLGHAAIVGFGALNDLWKYNIANNEWTWMSGDNTTNVAGVLGTKGVTAATNKPGGKWIYTSWKDNTGNLWLFGGMYINELWKYDIGSGMWTWMSGGNTYSSAGSYGVKCVEDTSNVPGGRLEARTRWTDDCGNFWLFGGMQGYGGGGPGTFNDLWRYNVANNAWTWVSGTNTLSHIGVYGALGVPAPANVPRGRNGSVGWRDKDGLWLFGGATWSPIGNVNDLWKYIPETPTISIVPDTSGVCAPFTINFTSTMTNCIEPKSYLWYFDDPSSGASDTSTLPSPSHAFNVNGTYNVKLIVTNCLGITDSVINPIVFAAPVANAGSNVTIIQGGNAQLSAIGGVSYSWTPSAGLSCTDCVSPVASPSITTTYYVVVTDGSGCTSMDSVTVTVDIICQEAFVPNAFSPNNDGQNDVLVVQANCLTNVIFTIYDRWGEKIFETTDLSVLWDGKYNGKDLNSAVFVYHLSGISTKEKEPIEKKGNVTLLR